MANLRILQTQIIDQNHLSVRFTSPLSEDIGIGNVAIVSEVDGVDDPSVTGVVVQADTLKITTEPLLSLVSYTLTFQSTDDAAFSSLNGDAFLPNDSVSNRVGFLGPMEDDNPVKEAFRTYLRNNVYDLDPGTGIDSLLNHFATSLSQALYTIGQTKSDNYLSFTVRDEIKTRGVGAHDRLKEEGAYEILRVGLTPTGTTASAKIQIDTFPDHLYSLISNSKSDSLQPLNTSQIGSFNLQDLTLTVSSFPVSSLDSVTFIYNSVFPPYVYDIEKLGYQIKDSRYDKDFAYTYLPLEDNQFRLSSLVLTDPNFSLENIASVDLTYEFKNEGIDIDSSTLQIASILPSGRETLPPIQNIVNLKHFPLVKKDNSSAALGDVIFSDPYAGNSANLHPAFLYEIAFRYEQLPSRPGEYAVDYGTGTVYVYGEDTNQTGTGAYPPVAIYNYRVTYSQDIDYTYDQDDRDISALPNGNLTNASAIISYNYEQTLVPGIDFNGEVHQEALEERAENRLIATNCVKPLNFPVTDAFRIYNETTGEIYPVTRWNQQGIFFSYQNPPKVETISGEKVHFDLVENETLFIAQTTAVSGSNQVMRMLLQNNSLMANSEDSTGYFRNSSVTFSKPETFVRERYWDRSRTELQNTTLLADVGDYQIDYDNGVVYLLASGNQDFSVGTISYRRGYVLSSENHIISVSDLYYKVSANGERGRSISYLNFQDSLVLPGSIDVADESLLSTGLPYQIEDGEIGVFEDGYFVSGVKDSVKYVRGVYERIDLENNVSPVDFSSVTSFQDKILTVSPLQRQEYRSIEHDGSGFFLTGSQDLPYLSPQITVTVSVVRISDSTQLWNGSGTIQTGPSLKFRLPGINGTATGQAVLLTYTFEIQDLSRVIVDYSRGNLLIDYSYLADELIVSYEYGDNVLNFSKSPTVEPGDTYYVSYKAGALRDALLRNFGTLIDIPILNNLNVDFARERYRDALIAAMQSFTEGPTISSLQNIVQGITHTPPEIDESAFSGWSLGTSLLSPEKVKTAGNPEFLPSKHGSGIRLSDAGQELSFPVVSNLKLESGTLEMWVTPEWNGIDNQADLIFFILKDQGPIPVEEVFLGPSEEHPEIIDGRFVIPNPTDYYLGKPQKNKPGIFIYLAPDTSKIFNRWNLDIVYDGYDGYHDGYAPNLTINVQTHGSFYDVKNTPGSMTTGGTIRSGENQINFELNSSGSIDQGITFTADYEHYFFDFGTDFETKYKEKKPFFIRQLQDYLLTEEGDYFITEDGDGILVENGTGTGSPVTVDTTGFIGTEDGDPITTESGEQLII